MALTALVPVVGGLVLLTEPTGWGEGEVRGMLPDLVLLFLMGASFHVYGFVLNEWADLEVDRASQDLGDKPLVSGRITPGEAKWTAVAAALLCFVPMALLTTDPWPHATLACAVLAAGAYDLWGKRFPLDVVLAGSLTLILIAGAQAVGALDLSVPRHLTLLACVGGLQFLQNLYQNAIEGGIKDADHDAVAGARTYAAVLGVRITEDGDVATGRVFTPSALVMKGVQMALLLYTAVKMTDLSSQGFPGHLWLVLILALAVMVVTTSLMLPPVRFDRARLKRMFSIHELATFGAIMTVLVPLLGEEVAIGLFLLPMVWFMTVNRVLFGGTLEPGV